MVIDRGRVVLEAAADGLRGIATTVSGPVLAVDEFTAGRPVWHRRRLGSQASVVTVGQLDEAARARARTLGLDLVPLTLQQLVVHAAGWPASPAGSRPGRGKRMSTLVKVARYHLVQPFQYLVLAWAVLGFASS